MDIGIKQKILFVLAGVLALTTALNALLASYYTNRQNQESAFTSLNRDLLAWQNDLQALTLRLRDAALSASNDGVLLNQLGELATLQLTIDDPQEKKKDLDELARALSYKETVPLNRLHLVLGISGFSSITTYIDGKLNHYVSTSEAGMMIRRGNTPPVWVMAAADSNKKLDFQSWPAWQERAPPPTVGLTVAEVRQPTVSVTFPAPEFASIEIIVPLQGVIEEMRNDYPNTLAYRLVSDLTFTDTDQVQKKVAQATHRRRATLAALVFRKRIDLVDLQDIATRTGKWPALYSLDGSHQLLLNNATMASKDLLQKARTIQAGKQPQFIQQTVTTRQGSFYETLQPWQFENQTRLILGLMSSRDRTLQNISQTVTAILIVASLILILSMGVGTFLVGRFIDPIVALTNAVKRIGIRHREQSAQPEDKRIAAEQLHPIDIEAPDEIGELSAAFNVMIAELRRSIETLEQHVQDRTAELRQQTRYLRTLIDTLPLWVWLKDTQCRYLITNQASAAACGSTVDEIIGKSDQELWPPQVAQRHLADDTEVMTSRHRKTVEEPIEIVGGVIWMETHRAPVLDEDGTVLGTVGAASNISERKAAEEAREKSLAEAVRLARQRSEFLAQMSHELRTPLNAILGYAQILRRDSHQMSKRQTAGLVTIQESAHHLLTLINDILDLARVEAGKLALYPSSVDLSIFLRVVEDIIRVKAEEKSMLFTYEVAPDLPAAVKVDDKRLRQVLLNLLGNAVKFTDRGGVVLRVQRMPSPGPGNDGEVLARLRFEVQDSGIGMTEEQCARLFQPFEQVSEPNRREAGTGLGLAISQQLIHLMGGHIQVKSQLNMGSLFWFELNLPVSKAEITLLPEQQQVIGYEGSRKKMLIVDDVPQNRAMLMDALHPLGFEVVDATNGQECLEQLDSTRPDLIVMDVMMPVLNGWEATRRIRSMPAFSGIPIIMVTASATSEVEAKAYEAGVNAFIPKPIEYDMLLKTIGDQLSLKWIYAKSEQEPGEEQADKAGDFVIPPRDELDELYRLARMGNMQDIHAFADHLRNLDPRHGPFAAKLRDLADSYQSKAIVAFVEKYRAEHEEVRAANPSV
jgi:PAS domain S-box-containing protein